MSSSRSATPSSISRFFASISAAFSLMCFSCIETNFSSETDSSIGMDTSSIDETCFRLRSMRFCTRSRIFETRSSSLKSPEWMRWR